MRSFALDVIAALADIWHATIHEPWDNDAAFAFFVAAGSTVTGLTSLALVSIHG